MSRIRTLFSDHGSRRVLILVLVAAAVVGSMAVYRSRTTGAAAWFSGGAAVSNTAPLDDNVVQPILALNHATEELAERVSPAVVFIQVTARAESMGDMGDMGPFQQFFGQFFGQMPQRPRLEHGEGSGVIISPDGYIVTNEHVVKGATNISIGLTDQRSLDGKVIATDPLTDIAVVKVNGSNLPNVPWGDSRVLKPGDFVLAIGNPFGNFARFSVTRGIVSAVGRRSLVAAQTGNAHAPGNLIQTDAAINPGNSGGALVNARGEVIGINEAILTETGTFNGVGFAIPSELAKPVADSLIRNGRVVRGFLGIGIQSMNPAMAKQFGMTKSTGAVVSSVEPGGPAEQAGIQLGDVITAYNGKPVTNADDLQIAVGFTRPNTPVTLDVMRNGHSMTVHATVGELKNAGTPAEAQRAENGGGGVRLGIQVEDLTPDLRQQLNIPTRIHGAIVTSVQPGSASEDAGLTRGDVIVSVDRHMVNNSAELRQQLRNLPKNQDVLLLVFDPRANGTIFVVVHPHPAPAPGPATNEEDQDQSPQ